MKLLSWMHRKLQKDTTSSFKDSATGSPCLLLNPSPSNQEDYVRSGNNSKLRHQPQYQSQHYLEEFNEKIEEINNEESTDIFPGFLTIGTLSVELVTEPSTPTFDFSHDETNEDGMPEMKYDLKLINDELEKFLRDEAEKEGNNGVSGRVSEASAVTLADKEKEEVDEHKYMKLQAYPLQGYLLGSSTELLQTKQQKKKEKKFLQELFQNSRITNRSSNKKVDRTHKQAKKESKSSTNLPNKMLQTSEPYAAESFPTRMKLNKIKRLFHKKIHPEIGTATKDCDQFSKDRAKKNLSNSAHSYSNSALSCESNRMGCWGILMKGEDHQSKTDVKLQDEITKKRAIIPEEITSGAGREHWVNTDEDYLVLELQHSEEVPY